MLIRRAAMCGMEPEERADAWGACHELAVLVHRATREWPVAEIYGLAAQARRAVVAVVVNVADDPAAVDPARRHRRVKRALRALSFLNYILVLAHELGYMAPEAWRSVDRLRHRAEVLTRALIVPGGAPLRSSQP